uniref:U4-agatoxin-Ao1a n=1 Tax=Agelena orientalis TaxID=293813 RepID=TXAG4_AGEOR|nr:RecName: Full=U4-agatoxin-Ao1a; Short=U4-AGTX-Ao1a; AltName: Full=Mu-2Aaga_15; Flags: Precursor [Agelena orientalis]AAU87899.1 toxin-like structure mu-2Aaga_15 precursor [Agelena orientalis]
MKKSTVIVLSLAAFVLLSVMQFSAAEDIKMEVEEQRGYCAEKGIKCHNIHCCSGLTCKCKGSSCVCRK